MYPNLELFDVMHFENPQIKQFYDDFLHNPQKTPKKPSIILKILASPHDIPSAKIRKFRTNDLFNELLEQDTRAKSPFSIHKPNAITSNPTIFLLRPPVQQPPVLEKPKEPCVKPKIVQIEKPRKYLKFNKVKGLFRNSREGED